MIGTHDPSIRANEDSSCLRPRCLCNRSLINLQTGIKCSARACALGHILDWNCVRNSERKIKNLTHPCLKYTKPAGTVLVVQKTAPPVQWNREDIHTEFLSFVYEQRTLYVPAWDTFCCVRLQLHLAFSFVPQLNLVGRSIWSACLVVPDGPAWMWSTYWPEQDSL
jgi:hypothetical protein